MAFLPLLGGGAPPPPTQDITAVSGVDSTVAYGPGFIWFSGIIQPVLLTSGHGASNTTFTTATITPANNRGTLVYIYGDCPPSSAYPSSVSGCGITWDLLIAYGLGGDGSLSLYRANYNATTPTTGTVTITFATSQRECCWAFVELWGGYDYFFEQGNNNSTIGSASLTATLPSELIPHNVAISAVAYRRDPAADAGLEAGWTTIVYENSGNPANLAVVWNQTDRSLTATAPAPTVAFMALDIREIRNLVPLLGPGTGIGTTASYGSAALASDAVGGPGTSIDSTAAYGNAAIVNFFQFVDGATGLDSSFVGGRPTWHFGRLALWAGHMTSGSSTSGASSYETAEISPIPFGYWLVSIVYTHPGGDYWPEVTGCGVAWDVWDSWDINDTDQQYGLAIGHAASPTAGPLTISLGPGITQIAWTVEQITGVVESADDSPWDSWWANYWEEGTGALTATFDIDYPDTPTLGYASYWVTNADPVTVETGWATLANPTVGGELQILTAWNFTTNDSSLTVTPTGTPAGTLDLLEFLPFGIFHPPYWRGIGPRNLYGTAAIWQENTTWVGHVAGETVQNFISAPVYTTPEISLHALPASQWLLWIVDSGGSVSSATVTGCNLTWVLEETVTTTDNSWGRLFLGYGSSPTTGSLTITYGTNRYNIAWTLEQVVGVLNRGNPPWDAYWDNKTGTGPGSLTTDPLRSDQVPGAVTTAGYWLGTSGPDPITPEAGWTVLGSVYELSWSSQVVSVWKATEPNQTVTFTTPSTADSAAYVLAWLPEGVHGVNEGIASSTAYGTATLDWAVGNTSIESSSAFGTAFIVPEGTQTITTVALDSSEAYGTAAFELLGGDQSLTATALDSTADYGSSTVVFGLRSLGTAGSAIPKTAGSTATLTPTRTLAVGEFAVLYIGWDVDGGTTGNTITLSVSDTGSNTWTRRGEYQRRTASLSGVKGAIFTSTITTQLTTSSTITVTESASAVPVAKALSLRSFSITPGASMQIAVSTGGSSPPSATSVAATGSNIRCPSGAGDELVVPALGRLWLAINVAETTVATGTQDADYTSTEVKTTAGSDASNVRIRAAFRNSTVTNDTYSFSTGATSCAHVAILTTFDEILVPADQTITATALDSSEVYGRLTIAPVDRAWAGYLTGNSNFSTSTTFESLPISPVPNSVVMLWAVDKGTVPAGLLSVAGCNLTWASVQNQTLATNESARLWLGWGASPTPGTVTLTYSANRTHVGMTFTQITGVLVGPDHPWDSIWDSFGGASTGSITADFGPLADRLPGVACVAGYWIRDTGVTTVESGWELVGFSQTDVAHVYSAWSPGLTDDTLTFSTAASSATSFHLGYIWLSSNTILPQAGIPTSAAYGTATIAVEGAPAEQNITATGLATSAAYGTATLTPGAVTIVASSIATAEAIGTARLAVYITTSAIASAETVSTTARLDHQVVGTGIATSAAYGSATFTMFLEQTGIASSAAYGTATLVLQLQFITASALDSSSAYGTAILSTGTALSFNTGSPPTRLYRASGAVPTTGPYTIMFWVNPHFAGRYQSWFMQMDSASSYGNYFFVGQATDTDPPRFQPDRRGATKPVNITLDVWAHYAVSSGSADGTGKVYLDGVDVTSPTTGNWANLVGDYTIISGDPDTPGNWSEIGITALKIWNVQLSEAEVNEEMGYYAPQRTDGLWAWWTLRDATTEEIEDRGSSGLDWTSVGSPTTEPGPNLQWTSPTAPQTIGVSAIASQETIGTTSLVIKIEPSAIASSEVHGSTQINFTLRPTSINTAEQVSSPALAYRIYPASVLPAEAHGTPKLNFILRPTGVASAEAFGTLTLRFLITATGIISAEALGSPSLSLRLSVSGIASAEAHGTTNVAIQLYIICTGVATAEEVGTPTMAIGIVVISSNGIVSEEALGSLVLLQALKIIPSGVTSLEAVGTLNLRQQIILTLTSVPSAEVFGTTRLAVYLRPTGIVTAEAIGSPSLTWVLAPSGIITAEVFGTVTLYTIVRITATGIVTAEGFGGPVVGSFFVIFNTSIDSAEVVSNPSLLTFAAITCTGIGSAEFVEDPSLRFTISVTGVASQETVSPARLTTFAYITVTGVGSSEVIGDHVLEIRLVLRPGGIGTGVLFGTTVILGGQFVLADSVEWILGTPTGDVKAEARWYDTEASIMYAARVIHASPSWHTVDSDLFQEIRR